MNFRDLQYARYRMTTAQLSADLTKEKGCESRELFGASISIHSRNKEMSCKVDVRFGDEICALRAYIRAALLLQKSSGHIANIVGSIGGKKACQHVGRLPAVRISGRSKKTWRSFDNTATARQMEDFVDVGVFLHLFPHRQLELLVERYVFGRSIGEMADEFGCCASSIGGQLAQARRALRDVLKPLLPRHVNMATAHPSETSGGSAWRRDKVSRFLRKRMEERLSEGGE